MGFKTAVFLIVIVIAVAVPVMTVTYYHLRCDFEVTKAASGRPVTGNGAKDPVTKAYEGEACATESGLTRMLMGVIGK